MAWNIIEEKERFIIQCTGDELEATLPDEVVEEASMNPDLQIAINETYSERGIFEFYVQKKDTKPFDIEHDD